MQFKFLWYRGKLQVALNVNARFILALFMLLGQ